MARVEPSFYLDTNYEVTKRKPFDARTVVTAFSDLTTEATWLKSGSTINAYNGLPVAVVDTSDVSKNGFYYLFDPAATSALKKPDVTNEANWHKLCELSELNSLSERVAELETAAPEIDFEVIIEELKKNFVDVETYNYDIGRIDAAIGAIESIAASNDIAIQALVGDYDADKTIRQIIDDTIADESRDTSTNTSKYSDIKALLTQVIDNTSAIEALIRGGVSTEAVYAAMQDLNADALIDNSDEIITNGRQLKLKDISIEKIIVPDNIELIISGGNA